MPTQFVRHDSAFGEMPRRRVALKARTTHHAPMKIYTKTGDAGETALFGGKRVGKDNLRVQAYGTVDELNSCVGVARANIGELNYLDAILDTIQHDLFDLGAELAAQDSKSDAIPKIENEDVGALEVAIDDFEAGLPELKSFILPGGTPLGAALHMARTVCRRAEREVVSLQHESNVREVLLCYLNRLSDALFVFARLANHSSGVPDVPWIGRERKLS